MKLPRLPHQGARSRELDFVRGIAILMVMGVHFFSVETHSRLYRALEFPGRTFGGQGVDLFFVLSGFLVGGLLMKEYKKTGGLSAKAFIFRRGFKIWPAYYVFILIEVVTHAHPLGTFLWQNLFHLQNYVGSSIRHTWTLSLEEHFYLLLAFAMGFMVKQKWQPERILRTFLTAMAVVFVVRCTTVALGLPGAMEYTHNRVDSLMSGVCLAVLYHFFPERFQRLSSKPLILGGITVAVVAFMSLVTNEKIVQSVGYTIIYVGACSFLLLTLGHSGKFKDWAIYKAVSAVGVYSYGIYLYHLSIRRPSQVIALKLPHAIQWPAIMVIQFVAAVAVGVVMTQLVEWPFLRIRNRLIPQKVEDIGTPDEPEETIQAARPRRKFGLREGAAAAVLSVLAVEIGLRVFLGLGHPPLFQADAKASYVLTPNQHLKRFGKPVYVNRWGMRSEDVADMPAPGTLRVLFVGDSVTWGQVTTDQAQTFPYLVADKLGKCESLNPSCGGWAPENELGWLQGHGVYGSQVAVLVINDDDLYQQKNPNIVDRHPNYPSSNPPFALYELVTHYLLPKVIHIDMTDSGTGEENPTPEIAARVRKAIADEIKLVEKDGAKPIVALIHKDPTALQKPETAAGRAELRKFVASMGIPFVEPDLPDHSLYSGGPHPNAKGNKLIADALAPVIAKVAGR